MGNTLSEELSWRGLVEQTTYKNLEQLDKTKINFYFGADPSAQSMTVGNLAAIMLVWHFIQHGHEATLLVGGATGVIGDPDGKKTERELQTLEQIEINKNNIASQYAKLIGKDNFKLVDNYSWFKDINYLSFLRDIGKHVPMRHMVNRDFVKSRLSEDGAGISYAEFSYVLIQAYDFYYLNKHENITLQLCGSDQWGNSIAGVDLTRRLSGREANVLSMPLIINKATGQKFGKSEEGAVWLDENLTSVYQFYQFWLNTDDESAIDYLKIYTTLSRDQIESIIEQFNSDRSQRLAQKTLALNVTAFVHGEERANQIKKISEILFETSDYSSLEEKDFHELAKELGLIHFNDLSLVDLLVKGNLASSKKEAKNFLDSGAIAVNGKKYNEYILDDSHFINGYSIIRRGRNKQVVIEK